MRFVDTNVLLYAISSHEEEVERAGVARSLLLDRDLALSVQVLQEFYVQATRPTATVRIDHVDAVAFLATLRRYPIQETTVAVVDDALDLRTRWQLNYWDAAIVAAARALGCTELLTEDLQHNQDLDGLKVVNPFV